MKSFIIFSLVACASLLQGADFVTGQAARAVIGQYSFSNALYGSTNQLLGGASGLAWANGTLYVADANRVGSTPNNHRVMMFDTRQIPAFGADVSSNASFDPLCNLCGYPAFNVLGQADFNSAANGRSNTLMNVPTAVATDGTTLAVADTDNNRVMIWRSIPTQINQPADLVLGQVDLNSFQTASAITASTLRGPQGVWIQGGKFFVADTQNYRVLIWNSIPSRNNQPADVVLGQVNFTTAYQPPVTTGNPTATASMLLNPVSVTSDGNNLYVADLGFNRVLIWNGIPNQNAQPANYVIGQPDMTSTAANNPAQCPGGYGDAGCNSTINFPRFALSTGTRLFVADGGNDRILVFNTIPTSNGAAADLVLGQPNFEADIVSSQGASFVSTSIDNTASVDTIDSPMSLAWDGTNLYASDPTNRRVLLYTPADVLLGQKAVLNTASKITRQEGFVTLADTSIVANDTVSITIGGGTPYMYTIKSTDTLETITTALVTQINAGTGDQYAIAIASKTIADTIFLDSRSTTADLNTISLAATTSNAADITTITSGGYLTGGNAGTAAPGTLVEIDQTDGGSNLADQTENANTCTGNTQGSAGADCNTTLPLNLGGVQVYMDGILLPLVMASPKQIVAQVPFTFTDRTSSSLYVRTLHNNGNVTVTTASPVTIAPANPGLFALAGEEPRPAYGALHQSGNPTATVSIDGSIQVGDLASITVGGATYTYTVATGDTLVGVATNLAAKINAGSGDPNVTASVGGAYSRVVLMARQPGGAGTGIAVTATQTAAPKATAANIVVTAYQSSTCCVTSGSGPVTPGNPAIPNETITFLATGLGTLQDVNGNLISNTITGLPYAGIVPNSPVNTVSATVAGSTAQVVTAGVALGSIGVYQVQLIMPSTLTTNNVTPVYIAQNAFISNTVTIPVSANAPQLIATPNPIPVPAGQLYGATTITWTTAATSVELHVGSGTGPIVSVGGGTGSVTTGNWVTDGLGFWLQDASNGNPTAASNTLAIITVHLQVTSATASGVSFTANPDPVLVPAGTIFGQVTLGWTVPSGPPNGPVQTQEVRVGSAGGPLLSIGVGTSGSVTTGNWVTDGEAFYLQNSTPGITGSSTDPANTLQKLTVNVIPNSSVATTRGGGGGGVDPITPSLSANPSPVTVGPDGLGHTTINWSAPSSSLVEIHVNSSSGPVLTTGGTKGSASTGEWVSNDMTFFLQDASRGDATNPSHTLASATVSTIQEEATISASPATFSAFSSEGQTTINWKCAFCTTAQVHVNSPSGPLFAAGGSSGNGTTGYWVTDGMTFYLQDATIGDPSSPDNTVGTVTVNLH